MEMTTIYSEFLNEFLQKQQNITQLQINWEESRLKCKKKVFICLNQNVIFWFLGR